MKANNLKTTLYSKPTDSHLYLNHTSNHPKHVLKNLPKGQFIRIRRICSKKSVYFRNSKILSKFFLKRGYSEKAVQTAIDEVALIERKELLYERQRVSKEAQTIFVADWHHLLSKIPIFLKQNFHIIENDPELGNIFKNRPMVAFRRTKTIRNYVVKNDMNKEKKPVGAKKMWKV